MSILNPSLYYISFLQPSVKTSDKLEGCLPVQGLKNNSKSPKKKCYKHRNERHHKISKVDVKTAPLIAAPPQQHPYYAHTDNGYHPSPVFGIGSQDINTIFDAEDCPDYFLDSHLQSQSNLPSQSSQLSSLFGQNKSLVMPSLSSMTLSTNLRSHPQSIYEQYILDPLPPYEDIQSIHYNSRLTTTQQPIMSYQQDYFAIPTLSMSYQLQVE